MKKSINWNKVLKVISSVGCIAITAFSVMSFLKQNDEVDDADNDGYDNIKPPKRDYRGYVPVGCSACGGPSPMCRDACPAFDD